MNVQELRNNGFKVRVIHKRLFQNILESGLKDKEIFDNLMTRREFEAYEMEYDEDVRFRYSDNVCPFGGLTRVEITCPDGTELSGEARCSISENYSKRKGLTIAMGRAFNGTKGD